MRPEQILLVESSFLALMPQAAEVAEDFYARLFAREPGLRKLFPADMAAQNHKFIQMLEEIVSSLDQLDKLWPEIVALGERHRSYGVPTETYAPVGAVLLETLEAALGPAWTRPTEEAWVAVYSWVALQMQLTLPDK